jgi:hypothetical protein
MKNRRGRPRVETTHVKQPGPGKRTPRYIEYAADTPEQRAEIRRIATEYAEKHDLKITITDIDVHASAHNPEGGK